LCSSAADRTSQSICHKKLALAAVGVVSGLPWENATTQKPGICRTEHDPEKWMPVFGKIMRNQ
jgi:hypothetical protein